MGSVDSTGSGRRRMGSTETSWQGLGEAGTPQLPGADQQVRNGVTGRQPMPSAPLAEGFSFEVVCAEVGGQGGVRCRIPADCVDAVQDAMELCADVWPAGGRDASRGSARVWVRAQAMMTCLQHGTAAGASAAT